MHIPEDHSVSITWADADQPVFWEYRNSAMGELIASGILDGASWTYLVRNGSVPPAVIKFLRERGVVLT